MWSVGKGHVAVEYSGVPTYNSGGGAMSKAINHLVHIDYVASSLAIATLFSHALYL